MSKHTVEELKQWQSLPLSVKVKMTCQRVRDWVNCYGEDGVYVSFSGGKDSTVLLYIVREICGYKNIPAVFVDTGLEYPEIRQFVSTFQNVTFLKPDKNFREVILEKGYPFISKEISDAVSLAKRGFKSGMDKLNGVDKFGNPCDFRSGYKKWKFLVNAPFDVSDECCWINKKAPAKKYEQSTGRKPILGVMATESSFRKTAWLETGCNSYDSERPMSKPMSFWTEQDVLLYIKQNGIKICSVYGEILEVESQVNLFEQKEMQLRTTGCDRTGCIYCGYGCHLKSDNRFTRLHETHPQIYDWIMKPVESGGLGYKEIIDWLNKNGNLHIKY